MKRAIKLIIIAGFLLLSSFFFFKSIYAQDCNTKDSCEKLISEYEKKLGDIRTQKNTLSSQIGLMDTQITLTSTRIIDTGYKIEKTEAEIENLGEKIEGLNSSLDRLGKILLRKIVEGYKRHDVPVISVFLDSKNATSLMNRLKYVKSAQENDRRLAFQVQQAKLNFEEQKELREKKKIELDQLKVTLDRQKIDLANQKSQKQKLLIDTGSDELTYQRLLSQAQAQLSGFKSFVQSSGGGSTIGANAFGSGADGAYYSQRDERWASRTMGYSSENILNVGCLISSTAMFAKKFGQNVTPSDLAADVNRFYGNTAYVTLPWKSVAGKSYVGGVDVDQELANGNPVIVGVGGCSSGGSHFVLLLKKEGDDYIMHDPIYGPDLKFSSHYSNICTAATFK